MYIELKQSDTEMFTSYNEHNEYCAYISKKFQNWEYRLMDFLTYHHDKGMKLNINVSTIDLNQAKKVYQNSHYNDPLRPYESEVLTHSTTSESWHKIKSSGKIKSWNKAKNDGDLTETEPIGAKLNDPIELRDYVMLGQLSYFNEIVVMCKQKNELLYDPHLKYTPGARIYIDMKKIADDGLLTRDGLHMKVKDEIDLNKYAITTITANDFNTKEFTPYTFSKMADDLFNERFNKTI